MRNVKLTIEYDGTEYAGWQRQPDVMTVQEALEVALERVTGTRPRVVGSGRTDAGVHAEGQVANFRTESDLRVDRFIHATNHYLPPDIAVVGAAEVPLAFHAQRDAKSKRYRYRILRADVRRPLRSRFALLVKRSLDVDAMRASTEMLAGSHDFAAFASELFRYETTVRDVHRAELAEVDDELHFTIEANGFLYNMVRSLVGTLLWVGSGKLTPEEFRRVLETGNRGGAGPTAPAQGLCMVAVFY